MTKARSNATANAAKGDLTVGNGTNLSGVLAVGSTGDTIVADSSTSTGLRYQAPKSVNGIINSNFSIWQRGTANNTTYLAYTADRWQRGGFTHWGVSRTTVSDTTNLPFIQYAARLQRTSGSTNTGLIDFAYSMETADAIKYAGQTVTMSFYARKGANYSGAAGASFGFALYTGTGTDQSIMTGYTGSAATLNTGATLTTTMARYQATVTIPTTATELALYFSYTPTGTAGAADYVDITGVQLEVGSIATPYTPYSGTIQGELAACQRYYWLATSGLNKPLGAAANSQSTTQMSASILFPVTMRTTPTLDQTTGTGYYAYVAAGSQKAATSFTLDITNNQQSLFYNLGFTGLTAGQAGYVFSSHASGYLAFSAEL